MTNSSTPTTPATNEPSPALIEAFSIGEKEQLAEWVLEFIIESYILLSAKNHDTSNWKNENKYSQILVKYMNQLCSSFEIRTQRIWHVTREYFTDELVMMDEDDADKAPRIDIVTQTWKDKGFEKHPYRIECKRITDKNDLIKKYVQSGIIEKFLTKEKDYAAGSNWGGLIGYVQSGLIKDIITKINIQIDSDLDSTNHLKPRSAIHNFNDIYISQHFRNFSSSNLKLTHLFLSF